MIVGQEGLDGLDELDNQLLLAKIYQSKMNEYCTLNFVPAARMSAMVDKYVNSNESHGLETFFDHEVFRAAYTEIRKNMLELNLNQKKSYREISLELEKGMRERVQHFFKGQFIEDSDDLPHIGHVS